MTYIREHQTGQDGPPRRQLQRHRPRVHTRRDMPKLDDYLHYRMIDVSWIKELCRRWSAAYYFGQPGEGSGAPRTC